MKKGLSNELIPYVILVVSLVFISYFLMPKLKLISATPYVYEPDIYNVTEEGAGAYVLTEVFQEDWNVTVRANVSAESLTVVLKYVNLSITDPSGVIWLDNVNMTPVGIPCNDSLQ